MICCTLEPANPNFSMVFVISVSFCLLAPSCSASEYFFAAESGILNLADAASTKRKTSVSVMLELNFPSMLLCGGAQHRTNLMLTTFCPAAKEMTD